MVNPSKMRSRLHAAYWLFVAASCAPQEDLGPADHLAGAIRLRVGLTSGARARLGVVRFANATGAPYEAGVLIVSDRLVTPDGVVLLYTDAPSREVPALHEWLGMATVWDNTETAADIIGLGDEEVLRYKVLSGDARGALRAVLLGGDLDTDSAVLGELCSSEWDRLLMDSRWVGMDWSFLFEQAQRLLPAARLAGLEGVSREIEAVQISLGLQESFRRLQCDGELSEAGGVCLAMANAGDSRLWRMEYGGVSGRVSGAWLLRNLNPRAMSGLAEYWDLSMKTRYVAGLYEDNLRLVSVGEIVQAFARDYMAAPGPVSKEQFLEHVEGR